MKANRIREANQMILETVAVLLLMTATAASAASDGRYEAVFELARKAPLVAADGRQQVRERKIEGRALSLTSPKGLLFGELLHDKLILSREVAAGEKHPDPRCAFSCLEVLVLGARGLLQAGGRSGVVTARLTYALSKPAFGNATWGTVALGGAEAEALLERELAFWNTEAVR